MLSNHRNSLCLNARRRPGNTDRRYGHVVLIEDRSADAANSELYFLIIDSVAAAPDPFQRIHQLLTRADGLAGETNKVDAVDDLVGGLGRQIGEHRFAERRAIHGIGSSRLRARADPAVCVGLVQVDYRGSLQNSDVHGLAELQREPAEMGSNAGAQIDLLDGAIAEFVELEPQAVAIVLRSLDEMTALEDHQGAVRCALAKLHASADLGETQRKVALPQHVEDGDSSVKTLQLVRSLDPIEGLED